jgi:hypothetical protein
MRIIKNFNDFSLNEGESTPRKLSDIAKEIYADWKPVHAYAKPYAEAMATLDSIDDMYGADSASEIVARFLGNAASWRGEKAKAIKKELNAMLKNYYKK